MNFTKFGKVLTLLVPRPLDPGYMDFQAHLAPDLPLQALLAPDPARPFAHGFSFPDWKQYLNSWRCLEVHSHLPLEAGQAADSPVLHGALTMRLLLLHVHPDHWLALECQCMHHWSLTTCFFFHFCLNFESLIFEFLTALFEAKSADISNFHSTWAIKPQFKSKSEDRPPSRSISLISF